MNHLATSAKSPDFGEIKTRQQAAWSSGDYAAVGITLQIVGEHLAEAMDLRAGQDVLDVAAGNGNFSLAAARRCARVTSTDYVASLLENGAERARAERLDITFQIADAEALPFGDDSFDAVASTFGVMFTPDHERAAAELLRVCRPGGRIGMANWTADSFVGQLFRTVGRHLPPPAGVPSPALWGDPGYVAGLFGCAAAELTVAVRQFNFRYPSARAWLDHFRTVYGPVRKAFAALSGEQRDSLSRELTLLAERFNVAGDTTLVVPGDYLEVVYSPRKLT